MDQSNQPVSLARRSVTSVVWKMATNLAKIPVSMIQTVILARLLSVEYFGIVAGMVAVVSLTAIVAGFGLDGAFIHRSPETEDEERALSVLFTLQWIIYTLWAVLLIAIALIFLSDIRQLVLIVLTVGEYFQFMSLPARSLLVRRVQHRRLALLELTASLLIFGISVMVALATGSIWALLIQDIVLPIWTAIVLLIWKPIWRPRFAWDARIVKYYLSFGGRLVFGRILGVALDKVDDLWTNFFLGDLLMGYYSQAYRFAVYPRIIIAQPLNRVTTGIYAELKFDRARLSQAFNRVNGFLIRSGFLFGGWLAVIAPHLVILLLGRRWLPMLDAFSLMLVYTLLDPIKITIADTLTALGKPEKVSQARFIQFLVMLAGLFVLGKRYEIAGVALAVNLMVFVGIVILLSFVRPYVDYSVRQLFAAPVLALVGGICLNWLIASWVDFSSSDWTALIIKSLVFMIGYLGILILQEGKTLYRESKQILSMIFRSQRSSQSI